MSSLSLMQAERDIDRMPHEAMESSRYLNALDAREDMFLEDLISRPENVSEALTEWAGNLSDVELREVSALLRANDAAEIGRIVLNRVRCYWRSQASGRAIDALKDACPACLGDGCRRCEGEE